MQLFDVRAARLAAVVRSARQAAAAHERGCGGPLPVPQARDPAPLLPGLRDPRLWRRQGPQRHGHGRRQPADAGELRRGQRPREALRRPLALVSAPSAPTQEIDMDPVVHFEMPYDNRERIARFYETAFGWKLQMLGEEMGQYVLATTAEKDLMPQGKANRGAINGGFFPRSPDMPGQHPS